MFRVVNTDNGLCLFELLLFISNVYKIQSLSFDFTQGDTLIHIKAEERDNFIDFNS